MFGIALLIIVVVGCYLVYKWWIKKIKEKYDE